MKLTLVLLTCFFSLSVLAETFSCSDYTDPNVRYKEIHLKVEKNAMTVSFPQDSSGQELMVYPKIIDYGFKLSGFFQQTDVSGAVFTLGVDIYKETLKLHRYIVSGPGFNLVYGEAQICTQIDALEN